MKLKITNMVYAKGSDSIGRYLQMLSLLLAIVSVGTC